ncbi:Protein-tyrosine phosphatase, receptor/non-receptor type domain and Protein-tyrosine/Dual specificity phosphatase domain and Protein-tyrosine phosphatase, catalytic domain-containing protein [Strongyloides ratti]|uniref:Protein-tyrosine phosphatase, receptor/non-receptor type domain and Protein-tyrosine/Dual specificity phosphatase domain and Protein-tyrosine phosphatase, catalytic domain-containing protein n=1 Tax=Strongyloides ratti TaxID=34506 RepID=A0A090L7Q1_STRRB|nr:Protein-tyrosine phosphatase, receptor/non-receptor type domain and Protein-tyrosine/Dual specificity phosphatase domain and Protein-tyrosine phosphatase, catalytic domain-containing protein [Strongyloides ratti]CEF65826.1 Protein-tyrosine phosphatase, receptor/non-receptor type domain and Protein-tyrosine/Dual specificity phosphatase domain and Protein-tyrosine phosphatase, catalytic domain-containing protein [Strongyloides ratti]
MSNEKKYEFDIYNLPNPYIKFSLNVSDYPKNCYTDFWQMLFDKSITTIFAILSSEENEFHDAFLYYFPKKKEVFKDIIVEKIDCDKFLTEYYIFQYTMIKGNTIKSISIYYIYHWKPYKLPYTDKCIIEVYDIMRNLPENSNILIHSENAICTRVSSVIYFLYIYEEITNNPNFNNPMIIIKLIREMIPGGYIGIGDYNIIMKGIYELLYIERYFIDKSAYEKINYAFDIYRSRREQNKAKFEDNVIPFLEFACDLSVGRVLEMFHKSSSIRFYNKDVLMKLCSRFYETLNDKHNCLKNNFNDIPCQDEFIIDYANLEIKDNNLDGYVNANLMTYKCKNNVERQIIMTQSPHKDVCDEMLELIYCHNVSLIIDITAYDELSSKKFGSYIISNKDSKLKSDEFAIEITNVEIDKETGFKISFCNISTKFLPSRSFVHVLVNTWYKSVLLTNPKVVVNVYNTFLQYQEPKRPTIVHCINGIGRTGTFALFTHILDTLGESHNFDILTHLDFVRSRRLHAVPDVYQLFFTIQCLYEYFKFHLYELNPNVYHRLDNILKHIKTSYKIT